MAIAFDTSTITTPRASAPRRGSDAAPRRNPEITAGPTAIPVLRLPGRMYRYKVQNGTAEQHVYVQIADSLRPEACEEPLRSGIETRGESVLRKLLERGNVPTRIKITSGGITEVGVDRRTRVCEL